MMFEPDNIAIDTNNSDVGRCGREQRGGGRGRCHCLDAKYPGELSWGQRHLTRGTRRVPISPSLLSRYSQAPGRLFRSSPKLLHRASGPACRYAGHKSIPSNIQYLSSPPSLPSLRCRMLLFWGRCGKTVHMERDTRSTDCCSICTICISVKPV